MIFSVFKYVTFLYIKKEANELNILIVSIVLVRMVLFKRCYANLVSLKI